MISAPGRPVENASAPAGVFAGASWLAISKLGSQALSWVGTLYVANRLSPEDYGLSNLSTAFTEFVVILANTGIGTTLIQRQGTDRAREDSLFTLTLGLGAFLALCAFGLAYFGAWYFRNPALVPLTQFTAIIYVLTTLSIVPYNHLNRDMRFKERGLLDMYSVWVSITVQIVLASLGAGVWALLYGLAARALVRLWLSFRYSGYRPRLGLDWSVLRGDLGFSAQLTLNWLLFVIKERSVPILIGRAHTVAQLGLLGFAGSLAGIPNLKLVQLLREVLLPLLARRGHSPAAQLAGLGTALKGMALLVVPLYLCGWYYGAAVLDHILPAKWSPMFPLFQVICMIQLWNVLTSIVDIYNTAQGRPGRSTWHDLALALAIPGATFAFRSLDLETLAHLWSAIGGWFFLVWFLWLFRREGRFAAGFLGNMLYVALVCAAIFLLDALCLTRMLPGDTLAVTAARVLFFVAAYATFLRAFHWPFLAELRKK